MKARKTVRRMIPQLARRRLRTIQAEAASPSSRRNPAILPQPPTKSPKCRRKQATIWECKFVPFIAKTCLLVTGWNVKVYRHVSEPDFLAGEGARHTKRPEIHGLERYRLC